MTPRIFIQTAFIVLLAFVASPSLRGEELSPAEKAEIEALIHHLETLKEATFIRNGTDYDSKTAAKFLRAKWHAHENEIKTVEDFIAKAATGSSTTGKPYLIRLKGEPEKPCADYLTALQKKLEAAAEDR